MKTNAFLYLALLILPFVAMAAPQAWAIETNHVPVATELYVWYGTNGTGDCVGGINSSHWNDTRDRIVKDVPTLGFYCSADTATITYQLNELKSAGVNVLFVSWWNDPATTNALRNLLQTILANSQFVGWFRVVILVEPHNVLTDEVWGMWYQPYPEIMFQWKGKPLVIYFNQPKPTADSRLTIRTLGVEYSPDWDFWHGTDLTDAATGFNPYQYHGDPTISSDGVVTVIPRFDDYYLHLSGSRPQYQRYDPDLTEGMYAQEWNYTFQHVGEIRMVIVNSYNELHERNAIEPTQQGHGTLLAETARYVAQLHSPVFPVPEYPAVTIVLAAVILIVLVALHKHNAPRQG